MRKHSQISVHVPGNVFDMLLARVSELAAGSWRRDHAAEKETGAISGGGVSYVFYVRTNGPRTDVVFLHNGGQLTLNNIFTTGQGITVEDHGRISEEFWNAGMKQACQELGLDGKHTPARDVKPEDGLPSGVAYALKFFGLGANKSTGSADPDDMKSWCKFLALLHATGTEMDESRLSDYLTEKKFPEEIVMSLLAQYELAMALLPLYDEMLKEKTAPRVQ